jgi:hypothetical protein
MTSAAVMPEYRLEMRFTASAEAIAPEPPGLRGGASQPRDWRPPSEAWLEPDFCQELLPDPYFSIFYPIFYFPLPNPFNLVPFLPDPYFPK